MKMCVIRSIHYPLKGNNQKGDFRGLNVQIRIKRGASFNLGLQTHTL